MERTDMALFFLQICVLLITALIFGQIAKKLGQPSVIGELLGGILIGPTVFGALSPGVFDTLFPAETIISPDLERFIEFGMLLFMFVAGMEMKWDTAKGLKKQVRFSSLFGILIPLCLGAGIGFLFPVSQTYDKSGGQWIYALFMGTILSISSLPVILKTLIDLNLLKSDVGVVIMRSSAVSDLIGWTIFSCLASMIKSEGNTAAVIIGSMFKIAVFIVMLFMAVYGARRVSAKMKNKMSGKETNSILLLIVSVLFTAAIAEKAGVHSLFAVFLLGIAFGNCMQFTNAGAIRHIHWLAMEFFAPLYFISIGLKTNFLQAFDLSLTAGILVIACVGKIAGAGLGAAAGGMKWRAAMCVGFGLNSRGAIGIMISQAAWQLNIIDEKVFVALIAMSIITSLISGSAMKKILEGKTAALTKTAEEGENYGTN